MIQNISEEQPKSLQDYSSRLAGGGHLLGWKDRDDGHANWEAFFELPEPIDFSISNGPYHFPLAPDEKSNERQTGRACEPANDNEGGFVCPHYRFISTRLSSVEDSKEDYRRISAQFDLSTSPIDLTSRMSAYRNALTQQIQRQAAQAWRINREMGEVLKVFYLETGQAMRGIPKEELAVKVKADRPLVFSEIRRLFEEAIVGGATPKRLNSYWIPEIIASNRFVSGPLKEATASRLLSLGRSREPILLVAGRLARSILPLETMLEHLITGQDFSEVDHARRNMPDPWLVARAFQQRAKYVVYEIEVVAMAMTETREYILRHELRSLKRHVEAIKRVVSGKIPVTPDPKTIRNWITNYGRQVFGDDATAPRTP
ncbi:MAG: hypothetical protein U5K69_13290 [Balneolaceae bacterium]|nr:hypothetical protein [Balneolaceae bacterium]